MNIKCWDAWAPGIESREAWYDWALGKKDILINKDTPNLKHIAPINKRRLSQLTKMVLEVGHNLKLQSERCYTIFCSEHGEIDQQYKITKGILTSGEVRPSNFSLSVFNTPVSLLSIHEQIKEPALVLLAGKNRLAAGVFALLAQLNTEEDNDVLVIFADESLPEDYIELYGKKSWPYAFGILVNKNGENSKIKVSEIKSCNNADTSHPLDFLKWLIDGSNEEFIIFGSSMKITLTRKVK